ncbi:transposable element Tc1 transposase [Trichonephila clavipes]|nr:transposable element Tc1 transposase [Trichonephila clavipes]
MCSRHHIDDFMRGQIIGKIEEGRKITDVAREFDIAHSVVSRLWKSFKTTGMCSRRYGEVVLEVRRLQKTDISSYQQKRYWRTTAQQVANQFLATSGKQISKTVARRLRGGGTIRTQTCCVCPIDQTAPLPVCNGVVSITIGLNRTGHAYYSQMRVGSVCHRIVDAN